MTYWLLALLVIFGGRSSWAGSTDMTPTAGVTPQAIQPLIEDQVRNVVAVGFGYQRSGASSIRIRTYDALSGDMLSEDLFDLNVVGGEAKESEPAGDRIFAGSVGISAGGLTDFPMRVYDAQSGRFLWQGKMNFVTVGSDDPRSRTGRRASRNSTVTLQRLASDRPPVGITSHFLVQAIDPESGKAIWQQSFRSNAPVAEAIGGEPDSKHAPVGSAARDYEIVVRSYEVESGELVWSDRLSTRDVVEEMAGEESPDQAQLLPLWRMREWVGEQWVRWFEPNEAEAVQQISFDRC